MVYTPSADVDVAEAPSLAPESWAAQPGSVVRVVIERSEKLDCILVTALAGSFESE